MEKKTFNIHEFLERFEKEYDFIYDHDDNVAGVREAAAFMFALENMGGLD